MIVSISFPYILVSFTPSDYKYYRDITRMIKLKGKYLSVQKQWLLDWNKENRELINSMGVETVEQAAEGEHEEKMFLSQFSA